VTDTKILYDHILLLKPTRREKPVIGSNPLFIHKLTPKRRDVLHLHWFFLLVNLAVAIGKKCRETKTCNR